MKKIIKTALATSIALALTACGSSSKDDDVVVVEPTPTTLEITGAAIKGTLANALVEAFSVTDLTVAVASTQSDENGDYVLNITDESGNPIVGAYVIRVTADDDTTMTCDATVCGDVARGETVPAEALAGVTLSTVTYSNESGSLDADVNVLTTMATDIILDSTSYDLGSAEGFAAAQDSASQAVIVPFFGEQESDVETNLFTMKIMDATTFISETVVSDFAAALTSFNASFSGALIDGKTIGEQITETSGALVTVIQSVNDETIDADGTNLLALNNILAPISQAIADITAQAVSDSGLTIGATEVATEVDLDSLTDVVSGTGATGGN
jgi:hypothetical protein